jgi:hypothetical protein
MSWTEFYATMRDGAEFRFGTTYLIEFFEMPDEYTAADIEKITPAVRGEKPRIERFTESGLSSRAILTASNKSMERTAARCIFVSRDQDPLLRLTRALGAGRSSSSR